MCALLLICTVNIILFSNFITIFFLKERCLQIRSYFKSPLGDLGVFPFAGILPSTFPGDETLGYLYFVPKWVLISIFC